MNKFLYDKRKHLAKQPESDREAVMTFRKYVYQDRMDREEAEDALVEVLPFLNAIGAKYFLLHGTALGVYREGRVIEGDQDIDIGFLWEEFEPIARKLTSYLIRMGWEVRTVNRPFTKIRMVNAIRGSVKMDFITYLRWKDKRFCPSSLQPYAIVHDQEMLEPPYFDITWKEIPLLLPNPPAQYLELEYGPDWRTPAKDSVSRTRVKDYLKKEKIPNDLLD